MKSFLTYLLPIATAGLAAVMWFSKSNNNVCKTFGDYYSNRDSNNNCYYNPDVTLTVPQIIERNGYPVETYEVITQDEYILTVFRIPHGKNSSRGKRRKPVFLQHGANSNSGCFVNMGSKSLAFILADEGYDVWLGNSRGTKYSLRHLRLNHTKDPDYWNFSFHEYGAYDLRAVLGLVHTVNNQMMVYIGYSLGTTMMYVYSSIYPEIAQGTIEIFINIAPAAFVGGEIYSVPKLASVFWDYLEPILKSFSNGEIFSPYIVPVELLKYLCLPFPFQMKLCMIPHLFILGSSYNYDDPETLPVTLLHSCDKSSVKLWTHFAQIWYKETFEQFDYGENTNVQVYGTKAPPNYNLTNVKIPLYFIRAQSDLLVTGIDTIKLYNALPENNKPDIYIIKEEGFGHLNLLVATNVVSLVHSQIMKVINLLP